MRKLGKDMQQGYARIEGDVALASASLFSGGGIGDVGVEWGAGVPVATACEIVPSRAELIRRNFPDTCVLEGDVRNLVPTFVEELSEKLHGLRPWLITLSPPCQGMSANGAGRISAAIRSGKRPLDDERNRLILPGIDALEKLLPDWFVIENVRRMEHTVIRNEQNQSEKILACLARRIHPLGYTIRSAILDFRSYGVPHHRERLITIGCRLPQIIDEFPPIEDLFSKSISGLHPKPSHGGHGQPSPITLRESIGHLPPLDAIQKTSDENDPFHRIPRWNEKQYFWMQHTPEGCTAFDNDQCPKCGENGHELEVVSCRKCSAELAKPSLRKNGRARLVRGFRTSYRRMKWDEPAGTLTMNSGVISSDLKGHPDQNRVLSLREILILGTLDHPRWGQTYTFDGVRLGRPQPGIDFSPRLVREVIGESIPPLAMASVVSRLKDLDPRI